LSKKGKQWKVDGTTEHEETQRRNNGRMEQGKDIPDTKIE
jgi:hypothetical protein